MPRKFSLGTDFQSTCTFKNLNIHITAYYFNNLCHQPVATRMNITDFILSHRTVDSKRNHIGNYA